MLRILNSLVSSALGKGFAGLDTFWFQKGLGALNRYAIRCRRQVFLNGAEFHVAYFLERNVTAESETGFLPIR